MLAIRSLNGPHDVFAGRVDVVASPETAGTVRGQAAYELPLPINRCAKPRRVLHTWRRAASSLHLWECLKYLKSGGGWSFLTGIR
jgi:hypothetical protein